MPKNADILFVTDNLQGGERALAEYVYACKNAACLARVKNVRELVGLLKSYSSIRQLVIHLHSAPGAIILGGEYVDLAKVAEQMKGSPLRVTEEVVFDGCNAGTQGPAVIAFMRSVGAPRAVGYSVYHAYAQNKIAIPELGMDPIRISRHPVYAAIRKYLLPGQIAPEEMVKKKNDYFIYYEFFTRDAGPGAITSERDQHGKKARSELVDKVFTPDTAKAAAELDNLGGPMFRIIFEDKSAALK